LSTGGGFAVRANYTDAEEAIFQATRPVILNGIEQRAVRGDALDRAIVVELQRIAAHERRTEEPIYQEFHQIRPGVIGVLLTAVSTALRRVDEVRTQFSTLPRMADFAAWVAAAEPGLGWPDDTFARAYTRALRAATFTIYCHIYVR
jgi:hypothetical protein